MRDRLIAACLSVIACMAGYGSLIPPAEAQTAEPATPGGPAPAGPAPTGPAAAATPAAPGTTTSAVGIKVELNKLEDQKASCRAYLVVDNAGAAYETLKLDLVLFQTDGIIGRRFALDLAPLRADKRSVKLFDLDGVKCSDVGSFLVNDVLGCKVAGAEASDCLERIGVTSRTKVDLVK
ncbi:MAG: hypothetical protein AB7E80_07885 [Hyphomicrobiaceae bacterium]